MGDAIADTLPTVAARGDSIDSFEDLYRRTSRRVFAYIASLLRDPSAAEEVTAEVFERAYRRRGSFRARRGSPEAWLFGIARNAALDELRRRRRRATLETELEDPWCAAPEDAAEREERRVAVRAALATLEPPEREIVALKFAAGLGNDETAARAGHLALGRRHATPSGDREAAGGLP